MPAHTQKHGEALLAETDQGSPTAGWTEHSSTYLKHQRADRRGWGVEGMMASILLRSGAGVGRCQSQRSFHWYLHGVEQGRAPPRSVPTVLSCLGQTPAKRSNS